MRYLSAFFITSLLYVAFATAFLFIIPYDKFQNKEKVQNKKISLNYVQIITPKETEIIKKSEVEKKEKEVNIEDKTVKKKIRKKPSKKSVIKKKIVKKNPLKIETKVEEKIVKNKLFEVKKEMIVQNKFIEDIPKQIDYKEDFLKKNLLQIKEQIEKHVKYSKRARKMNIQGRVLVEFCITKEGVIRDIKALSGHKLLRKSTIKAIYQASNNFPTVQKNITIKIPIEYRLL